MDTFKPSLNPRTAATGGTPPPDSATDGLNTDSIVALFPFSRTLHYSDGEEVIVRGAESRYLYYVEKGTLEVSHTIDDTRIVVAIIGPASFFGEIGFFDGTSRVRDIRAAENSIVRVFDTEGLDRLRQENPVLYGDFVTAMARSICGKFRRILEEREPLTAYAASLSTGHRAFREAKPIPSGLLHTREWQFVNRLVEDFKASFFDLSYQLQKDSRSETPDRLQEQCFRVMDAFNDRLQETALLLKDGETADYLWGYAFKEIFPYFMRSRFAERAYYKPRGYAGDFQMMEMIYANEPAGDGKLGKLMDAWCLESAAARAVRGRRAFLKEQLEVLCEKRRNSQNTIRIMNLACGSNRELFDFLSTCPYTELIAALCIDADAYALEYTNRHVNVVPHSASVRLMNDNVVRWALGRVRHNFGPQDIIYSAGLTDYLDDRVCVALINRCYAHLEEGGTLILGNFGYKDYNKVFLDQILQWRLIHRTEEDLKGMFAKTPFGADIEMTAEENGVNLFAIAVKTK
ncbi:MAG: DNA-binding transcriptional dual regulator Crp [Syntrophorhabdus sp. PtaU1.Bin002]|nr:MAG: DNA-binding transcriptional dual regulator Crp [Syntrophorhabdus sp. PtaU1.Bin002]